MHDGLVSMHAMGWVGPLARHCVRRRQRRASGRRRRMMMATDHQRSACNCTWFTQASPQSSPARNQSPPHTPSGAALASTPSQHGLTMHITTPIVLGHSPAASLPRGAAGSRRLTIAAGAAAAGAALVLSQQRQPLRRSSRRAARRCGGGVAAPAAARVGAASGHLPFRASPARLKLRCALSTNRRKPRISWLAVDALSGAVGEIASLVVLYPLDSLKVGGCCRAVAAPPRPAATLCCVAASWHRAAAQRCAAGAIARGLGG